MNTANKSVPVFADSVNVVIEKVKDLRANKASSAEIQQAVALLLNDDNLFTKAQRPAGLKAVNKALGTNYSLTQIKRAAKATAESSTKKELPPMEKALRVDGLSGVANGDLLASISRMPVVEDVVKEAVEEVPSQIPPAGALFIPAEEFSGTVNFTLVNETTNVNVTPELTQENTMNTTTQTQATAQAAAGQVVDSMSPEDVELFLISAGVATEAQLSSFMKHFFANHQDLFNGFTAFATIHPTKTNRELLTAWVNLDPTNAVAFMRFTKAKVETQQQPEQSFGDRVITSLRGNRETGFSSGTVAAVTAVLGGGIEMAMRGSLSIGTGIGTALGATAGYFAAEATSDMMDSETGRYIVAGSIGLVAGGAGSRLGRMSQTALLGDSSGNATISMPGQAQPEIAIQHRPTDMSSLF